MDHDEGPHDRDSDRRNTTPDTTICVDQIAVKNFRKCAAKGSDYVISVSKRRRRRPNLKAIHRPKLHQALEFPRRGIGGSRSKYIDESLVSPIGTQVDTAERATVDADEFGVAGEQETGPQFEDRWP